MRRLPRGTDKYRGEWRYYRCTTCIKPIKIYKIDCSNGKWPGTVDICKRCAPNFFNKEKNMSQDNSKSKSRSNKIRQRKLLGDTKKVARKNAAKRGKTR